MLKTLEQFNKFIEGAKRKNLDVVFYKGFKGLNIKNNKRECWFVISISDMIHNFLAQKGGHRYHVVMDLEKEET